MGDGGKRIILSFTVRSCRSAADRRRWAIKYSRNVIIILHRAETLSTIPIKRGVQTELCLPVRTPRSRFLVNRKEINMSKTVVSSDNAPAAIGPYSPGIQAGNMVFLSGQLGDRKSVV